MNAQALAYYLTYQFIPKPFNSDHQFPRAHDPINTLKQNEAQIARNLYDHLNNTIKASLEQTTGPIGLLFSGGLDSAILLYLLRKNTSKKIYTISGAYASDTSHLKLCASLAKKYKTSHQELIITPSDLLKLSDLYTCATKNPIGDNGFLATHLMLKALSPRTDTVYSGDGADCLFHGLKAHYLDHLDRNYLHPSRSGPDPSPLIAQKLLEPKANYPEYAHYKYNEIFLTKKEAHEYLGMDLDLAKPLKTVIKAIKTNDPIKRTILLDLNFLVVNRVDYIQQAAAVNKMKVILPYLDRAMVDLTLRIPSQYFIKGSEQKFILKEAFKNKLFPKVIHQQKRGMSPPFLEWYAQNQSFVLKTLKQAPAIGIAPEYIRYLVKNINRSDQYAYGMRIWLVLNLVLWHNAQRKGLGDRL